MSDYDFIARPQQQNPVWQPSMQDVQSLAMAPMAMLQNRIAVENALAQQNIDRGIMKSFLSPQEQQMPQAQQQQAYGQAQGQQAQQAQKQKELEAKLKLIHDLNTDFGPDVGAKVFNNDPELVKKVGGPVKVSGAGDTRETVLPNGKKVIFVKKPDGKWIEEKGGETKTPFEALEASTPILKGETEDHHQQRIYDKYQKDQAALTGAKATATAHAYDDQVTKIGDAIIAGTQPPEISGFGMAKIAAPLKAYLAEKGYDLTTAGLDYKAQQKYMSTLNGAQQVRLRQATDFAYSSLDLVEGLAKEWQGGNFAVLNKVNLIAAKNGVYGPQAASIATRLDTQIADLTSELGTVYKGGNSSTDETLKLAAKNLSSDWSEKVILDVIPLVRQNLDIRRNSQKFVGATTSQNPRQKEPSDTQTLVKPKDIMHIKGPSDWVDIVDGQKIQYKNIPKEKAARFWELHPNAQMVSQ
jgi:hypothetical protein